MSGCFGSLLTGWFSAGHSSLFPMEDERTFGEDESGDQGLAGLGSAHCFPHLNGERVERFSRKVFVGGLPPDIDEGKDSSCANWNTFSSPNPFTVLSFFPQTKSPPVSAGSVT